MATKSTTGRARKKPAKVAVGTSEVNASDLRGLQQAWQQKHLVPFIGAGVSIPHGLPSWRNLVLEMLFEQVPHTRRLGSLPPNYQRALSAWMTDYFDYNPLVLARMVEKQFAKSARSGSFTESLRNRLYVHERSLPAGPKSALQALAAMAGKGNDQQGLAAAVSFNFDDLLERELASLNVPCTPVFDGSRNHSKGLRVVHPHGYVPKTGPVGRGSLVFTETDYHHLTESVFHWGLAEIVGHLRNNTALFVGLSMSDPSLRRLMDASRNSDIPPHWQIQKRHQVQNKDMLAVMSDVERRASEWTASVGGPPAGKQPAELADAINAALGQADSYDQEVYDTMGVKTIWLNDWDDIPLLLEAIASP